MLALCHLSAGKNTNKRPTFPSWKYTISKSKKTKEKTFYLRGIGSKWDLHKIVSTPLESIFGAGAGARAVLGKSSPYFGSIAAMVPHCHEKGINLMTSSPWAPFKICYLLDNVKDWLKCLKSYRFQVPQVLYELKSENINKGQDLWQFGGHTFCHRTFRESTDTFLK